MDSPDFRKSLRTLFRETFEGVAAGKDSTWYVQGKEAIFDAVTSLSAEEAARRVPGQLASITAHVFHLNYYVSAFNALIRGEERALDWEGTWAKQEFSAAEWEQLALDVRREYDECYRWYLSDVPPEDQEQATYAVANLVHSAYHLGAIRALLPIVKAHV